MPGRAPSIRRFRFTSLLVGLACALPAAAQDLFETVIAPLVNAEHPSRFRF